MGQESWLNMDKWKSERNKCLEICEKYNLTVL
jgi:hypothetical protein